jgi:hypothetical protein
VSPLDLGSELNGASAKSEHPQPEVAGAPALEAKQRRHVVANTEKPAPMTPSIACCGLKAAKRDSPFKHMNGLVKLPSPDEMIRPARGSKYIVWKSRDAADLSSDTTRQAAVQHSPRYQGIKILLLIRKPNLTKGGRPATLRAGISESWRRRNLSDREAPALEVPPGSNELGVAPHSGSEAEAQLARVGAEHLVRPRRCVVDFTKEEQPLDDP